MIDREARDRLVDLLSRFLRDELNNSALSTGAFELRGSEDRVIDIISAYLDSHQLEMNDSTLRRCRGFLATDQEYGWPNVIFGPPKDYSVFALLLTFCVTIGSLLVMPRPGTWPVVIFCCGILTSVVIWLSKFAFYGRQLEAQKRQHRDEGREFDVWPFLNRRDLPPCSSDMQCSLGDS